MNNIFFVPFLVAFAITMIVFILRKDEPDMNKRPNYIVLFMICFVVGVIVMFFLGNEEESLNIVMKEIDVGDPDF